MPTYRVLNHDFLIFGNAIIEGRSSLPRFTPTSATLVTPTRLMATFRAPLDPNALFRILPNEFGSITAQP